MKSLSIRVFLALVLIFGFVAGPLYATGNEGTAIPATLTLEKARELALARSKALQTALLSVDSAVLDEKSQSYSLMPQASVAVGGGVSYPAASGSTLLSSTAVSSTLSVSQTIYEGGKNKILAAIDSLATQSARQEARSVYMDVLESTDAAYYAVLKAQAAVEAAKSDLSATQLYQSIAQAKYDAGIVIKSAVIEAQSETASKETALSQAQKTLSVANATLKSLTGVSTKPQDVVFDDYSAVMGKVTALGDDTTDAFVAELYASALAKNPTLAVSALSVAQAQKAINLAKADYLPSVSATFSHTAQYSVSGGFDPASDGGLTIAATIPLDILTTQTAVQSKTVAAKQAALESEDAADSLNLEIMSAVYELISAVRSVSSSQKALEYAQSHYEVVVAQYKLSKASSSDLSDALLLVSSNRSALISARYGFLTDLSALRTLAGLDSEAPLIAMLQ